jgi:hypothetical protein
MMLFLLAFLLAWQPPTAMQIQLLDEQNTPVHGVQVQLDHGQMTVIETNNEGIATLNPAQGNAVFVRAAILPDGTQLKIDPNTPRDGLRLALIPNTTRFVTLRVVDELVFLDPEHLFSGELAPPQLPPDSVPAPQATTPSKPNRYQPITRMIGRIIVLALLLALVVWTWRIAQYRRRKRP